MDIEITEKKNNPLFNRTEVLFTIHHKGEGTPNREIIRSEIADKLNVKKENIIINNITSSFGIQKSRGYAKIYSSPKNIENLERKYILNRDKTTQKEKKKEDESKKSNKGEIKQDTNKEEKNTLDQTNKKELSDKSKDNELNKDDNKFDSEKTEK